MTVGALRSSLECSRGQFSRVEAHDSRWVFLPHRISHHAAIVPPKFLDMVTSSLGAASSIPGNQVKGSKMSLKPEDFIKMMITQLQNQDPMEPAKNEELLAQMSQIGQLQSSTDLQMSLKTLVMQNNIGSAG